MKWSNLKDYECPKDGMPLQHDPERMVHECTQCEFQISEKKFDDIVNDKHIKQVYKPKRDNFEELQNLGRTEDYVENDYDYE